MNDPSHKMEAIFKKSNSNLEIVPHCGTCLGPISDRLVEISRVVESFKLDFESIKLGYRAAMAMLDRIGLQLSFQAEMDFQIAKYIQAMFDWDLDDFLAGDQFVEILSVDRDGVNVGDPLLELLGQLLSRLAASGGGHSAQSVATKIWEKCIMIEEDETPGPILVSKSRGASQTPDDLRHMLLSEWPGTDKKALVSDVFRRPQSRPNRVFRGARRANNGRWAQAEAVLFRRNVRPLNKLAIQSKILRKSDIAPFFTRLGGVRDTDLLVRAEEEHGSVALFNQANLRPNTLLLVEGHGHRFGYFQSHPWRTRSCPSSLAFFFSLSEWDPVLCRPLPFPPGTTYFQQVGPFVGDPFCSLNSIFRQRIGFDQQPISFGNSSRSGSVQGLAKFVARI